MEDSILHEYFELLKFKEKILDGNDCILIDNDNNIRLYTSSTVLKIQVESNNRLRNEIKLLKQNIKELLKAL